MPDEAAFFDFDKTLLHGDAGVIFGRSLAAYHKGLIKRRTSRMKRIVLYVDAGLRIAWVLLQELLFRTLYKAGIIKRSTLVRRGYRFLRGFPAQDMDVEMDRIWETTLTSRLYPRMLEVVAEHRAAGRRIVIVTTGLRTLIERAKRVLGDDVHVIGVEMGEAEGHWTGLVEGPLYGEHKRVAITEYAEKNGIDLAKSFAYSDHYSDYPFLAAVGNPVAVNPKRRLRRMAERRGWRVLRVPRPELMG